MIRHPRFVSTKPLPLLLRVTLGIGVIAGVVLLFLWVGVPSETVPPLRPSVTFSQTYAASLGLNWREVLGAVLDDLDARHLRIPVYWSIVQPEPSRFDWSTIDFQMDEIARRQAMATLAIGLKLPRWPECWIPAWAAILPESEEHAARLAYLQAAVERYREHPALESWQVENEALFRFGECPPPNRSFFREEIALVQSLDPKHPVRTTDSGELSTWMRTAPLVDQLGVSVYRVVRTPWGSVWPYDWIPPYWYARRGALLAPLVQKPIYISEFQMEPWVEQSVPETPVPEQFETFDLRRMQQNFQFAKQMQITEISFWGVEWWWWMKTQRADDRFWETAKLFFAQYPS